MEIEIFYWKNRFVRAGIVGCKNDGPLDDGGCDTSSFCHMEAAEMMFYSASYLIC